MKLSEKKKSVAGKMSNYALGHDERTGAHYVTAKKAGVKGRVAVREVTRGYEKMKGRASLTPVKHKVDVAGQESYKEEDK